MIRQALRQLPGHNRGTRPGRKVLIRTDAAGCTHGVLRWMHAKRLSYSVGLTLPEDTPELLARQDPGARLVALAGDLLAWMQMLDLHGHAARRWEPKSLRVRVFSIPATLPRRARRVLLHLSNTAPSAQIALTGTNWLQALPSPG